MTKITAKNSLRIGIGGIGGITGRMGGGITGGSGGGITGCIGGGITGIASSSDSLFVIPPSTLPFGRDAISINRALEFRI